ncbi:MAG: PIN domain-containing protein [Chloroflexi bacterium]|nr:PIN domain-containing protein [Chloroflexota bacterium]
MSARTTRTHRSHVFVDTSAFYALADPSDANNRASKLIAHRIAVLGLSAVTTTLCLAELHPLVLSRRGRHPALQVLRDVVANTTIMVRPTPNDERRAVGILEAYSDKDFSFTDAVSFSVMERLGVSVAFSFDRHLLQYGTTVLTITT